MVAAFALSEHPMCVARSSRTRLGRPARALALALVAAFAALGVLAWLMTRGQPARRTGTALAEAVSFAGERESTDIHANAPAADVPRPAVAGPRHSSTI